MLSKRVLVLIPLDTVDVFGCLLGGSHQWSLNVFLCVFRLILSTFSAAHWGFIAVVSKRALVPIPLDTVDVFSCSLGFIAVVSKHVLVPIPLDTVDVFGCSLGVHISGLYMCAYAYSA